MTFEILKDVPLPEHLRGRKPQYPLSQMGVGDCLKLPDDQGTMPISGKSRRLVSIRTACRNFAQSSKGRNLPKFAFENGIDEFVRCWRTE